MRVTGHNCAKRCVWWRHGLYGGCRHRVSRHEEDCGDGVSSNPKGHGSNVVYQRLRQRGYEVFAVNPNSETVEGDRTYPDLKSIPGGVEAVVIGTKPVT